MTDDFVYCTRAIKDGRFVSEPGESTFLLVPPGVDTFIPSHAVKKEQKDFWFKKLRKSAVWDTTRGGERGDILVFIHGYNNSPEVILQRHRRLHGDLKEAGFKGMLMSFDWPSGNLPLNCVEDRHDAKQTAQRLVTEAVAVLSKEQTTACTINVHLIGHSTGAYVIREAFDDADDTNLVNSAWLVSQIIFIGADVSADSLAGDNSSSESLYRHCTRLTNYSNQYDSVLKLSNAKRVGMSPRVGRVGLPEGAPGKAVNVDCTSYFARLNESKSLQARDQRESIGKFAHSWHIGNRVFAKDLLETLKGAVDRNAIVTRRQTDDGRLELKSIL